MQSIQLAEYRPAGVARAAVRAGLLPGLGLQSVAQQRAQRLPARHDRHLREQHVPASVDARRGHAAAALQATRLAIPLDRERSSITASGEPGDDPQSWSEPAWYHGEPYRSWFTKESDDYIKRLKKLPEKERPKTRARPAVRSG